MSALAAAIGRWNKAIMLAATMTVAVAAVIGGGVNDRLSTGGNEVPGSDSVRAAQVLERFGEGAPNLAVLVTEGAGLGPRAAAEAGQVLQYLRSRPDTTIHGSAWSMPSSSIYTSTDGTTGLIVAHISGTDAQVQERAADIVGDLRERPSPDGVSVTVGGSGPARADLITATDEDLVRAELIALPISLLILVFVFRTPIAAAMPLVVAVFGIAGTLAVLRILTAVTEVSVFARSVATAIGLAMAIDMSLFLVARYRELRPASPDAPTAVADALVAAGPSMLFSGLTTAASLAGLLAFSTPMLRSFAYAGVGVVLLVLTGALVVLPAVMMALGDRLDRWPVRGESSRTRNGWRRIAATVSRRPASVAAITLLLLVLVASPITRLDFGLNDDRVLSPSVESRQVNDRVRGEFAGLEAGAISVVFEDGRPPQGDLAAYRERLRELPGVSRVDDRDHWLAVVPVVEPISREGRQLVDVVRATPAPTEVLVGGEAARLVDNTDHVTSRLPFVLAAMVAASATLLAILFRSILIPVKAVLLNLLSLSAMFGAIVWIFQDGRLSGALGYTPTGLTDVTVPTLMFGIAFGLAMDYEVFLLSRIREHYLETGDTDEATAEGLQRTGGILSASAILMVVVFSSFATGSVTHLKVLGIGISLAVVMDAFLVRALLVPSFMTIAGRANWWPGIRRHHPRRQSPMSGPLRD